MDYEIVFPNGEKLGGKNPVVVIGPNGSGKTKWTRQIKTNDGTPVNFVNALRNTGISSTVPVMSVDDAKSNLTSQQAQYRANYWNQSSDFDLLISQLLAQEAEVSMKFLRDFSLNHATPEPEPTTLRKVVKAWANIFPGRELRLEDWKVKVSSSVDPTTSVEYLGNQMSDGEKAVLYLASYIFSASPCILVVDEPETHLHTLLAIRLWDVLEGERPDIRFVYVTHDLSFALSRSNVQYALANPNSGLKILPLEVDLPSDIAEILLGSASLSFYASRVIFTEGTANSLDNAFYDAWFKGNGTVVRSVGSCNMVVRCADALMKSGITQSLSAVGIIDGDFHSDSYRESCSSAIHLLPFHEVESLFCLPNVVSAIAKYKGKIFEESNYKDELLSSVTGTIRNHVIIERWKNRIKPLMATLIHKITNEQKLIDELPGEMRGIFDQSSWPISPTDILEEEKSKVESVTTILDLLVLFPGKPLVALATKNAGLMFDDYRDLIVAALDSVDGPLFALGQELEVALMSYLPDRSI